MEPGNKRAFFTAALEEARKHPRLAGAAGAIGATAAGVAIGQFLKSRRDTNYATGARAQPLVGEPFGNSESEEAFEYWSGNGSRRSGLSNAFSGQGQRIDSEEKKRKLEITDQIRRLKTGFENLLALLYKEKFDV